MQIKRINHLCSAYPCHSGLEDCTFCYCPFYPCLKAELGSYIYSENLKKEVWSCENCNVVHKQKTVDKIFKLIRENTAL
ncbi:MAG: hypothetical protein GY730_06095 [bacterium]|nr:hypothetical protein [bacterium]